MRPAVSDPLSLQDAARNHVTCRVLCWLIIAPAGLLALGCRDVSAELSLHALAKSHKQTALMGEEQLAEGSKHHRVLSYATAPSLYKTT